MNNDDKNISKITTKLDDKKVIDHLLDDPEMRKEVIRRIVKEICDKNDEMLRRLAKS